MRFSVPKIFHSLRDHLNMNWYSLLHGPAAQHLPDTTVQCSPFIPALKQGKVDVQLVLIGLQLPLCSNPCL